MLVGPINSGAGTGGAGAATSTGTSTNIISGFVYAVYVRYNDSPPAATTDITVKTKGTDPACPSTTILTIANLATDVLKLPRLDTCTALLGTANSTNDALIPVNDYIQVVIAQANDADNIDVWLFLV